MSELEQPAPIVYGKYQLLELLARGGMAEVFKAKAHGVEGFEKILVIKRILAELGENPSFVEMFVNEAKIAVTLSHANIVQVFDLGRADDTYFIAMEYVAGQDLATVLRRTRKYAKRLPVELAVYAVSEVAKGLDYAHRRRDADLRPMHIVHRDVSPQNVLLSWEGEVKLTDFGIAKARTTVPEGTEHGVIKGKYAYMAPEQARGEDVDSRTDLFALGTVLYECLSGQNPFLQPSTYETLQRVRRGEVKPLLEVAPEVPEELAAIVARAMHPERDERHENAGRFYEELIQFLYSTGRRVGAHDLAAFLENLRVAALGRRSSLPDASDAGLKAAFDIAEETQGRARGAEELTPVEVPSAQRSGAGPVTTGASRRTPARAAAARSERRDITLLAVADAEGSAVEHIKRNGGELVAGTEPLVAVFGLRAADGRDTEAAARAALAVAHHAPGSLVALEAGRAELAPKGEIGEETLDELAASTRAMLEVAMPGRPVVGPAAARGARRYFDLRARPDAAIPGVEDLLGERNLTEAHGSFVGRREALRSIGEVLAIAAKGRQALLSIVGEAGAGKTRLLLETVRRLRRGGHDVAMHVCRVPAGSSDVPLSTCQEMLRVILGIDELASDAETAEKVARLRELGLPRIELDAVSRTLGLGTVDPAGDPARPLRAAIGRIAVKLAEDRPTVFAFDDFEGVDQESLMLLEALVSRASGGRIVVVVAHRPDFHVDWGSGANHHVVRVGPLDDEDVARLTAARLGTEEVPAELLRDVKLKSAGNPLYIEEYVLALLDAGVVKVERSDEGRVARYAPDAQKISLPRSLRGIVGARLRRIPAAAKEALDVAAVIGGRFHDVMIAHITGWRLEEATEVLEDLVVRGLLVRAGAREYGFAHGLLPEVVRDDLGLETLRDLHGAVGRGFEEVYPDHLDELAERLAFHHKEAGNRTRAIDFLVRAADRLESEQALAGAIAYLRRALDMIAQDSVSGTKRAQDRDRTLELYRRLGDLCVRARELAQGIELMEAAIDVAEGLGREELVARFSLLRGQLLVLQNRFGEAQRWLDRARNVARDVGNRELLRDVSAATADIYARNGEYGRAVGLLREALELARDANDVRAQVRCLLPLALAYAGRADRDDALEALAEAARLVGSRAERIVECELAKAECLVSVFVGDLQRALDAGHRALELGKEYGFAYEASVNAHNLGEVYLRLGDYKRAFAMLRYSYDVARDHGYVKLQYSNLRVLGFIDATKLGSAEGRDRVAEAARFAEENGYLWDLVQARYMLAVVDHAQGRAEEASQALRDVLQLAADSGMQHYARAAEEALAAIEAGLPVPMAG
ncbi:MAG: protein kinase [Myxococcales bacterium]|nr:protein kinase [Myxococcales bacterium]